MAFGDDTAADWKEHRLFILSELRSLRAGVEAVGENIVAIREKDLSQVRIDIAMLQVKSGLWGAIAGGMVVLVPIVIKMMG